MIKKIRNLLNEDYVSDNPKFELQHYFIYFIYEILSTALRICMMGFVAYLVLTILYPFL